MEKEEELISLDRNDETDVPGLVSDNSIAYHLIITKGGKKEVKFQIVSRPDGSDIPLNIEHTLSREDYEFVRERQVYVDKDSSIQNPFPRNNLKHIRCYNPEKLKTVLDF
jgi:hypothetical protein